MQCLACSSSFAVCMPASDAQDFGLTRAGLAQGCLSLSLARARALSLSPARARSLSLSPALPLTLSLSLSLSWQHVRPLLAAGQHQHWNGAMRRAFFVTQHCHRRPGSIEGERIRVFEDGWHTQDPCPCRRLTPSIAIYLSLSHTQTHSLSRSLSLSHTRALFFYL